MPAKRRRATYTMPRFMLLPLLLPLMILFAEFRHYCHHATLMMPFQLLRAITPCY